MKNNRRLLSLSLIALMTLGGYSFANYQSIATGSMLSPLSEEDSTLMQVAETYSQEYVDSINRILDAKNAEDVKTIANVESSMDDDDIPHRSTWRTSMRSAPIHTIEDGKVLKGVASYYHDKFVGRKTANGEIFSQRKYTAACNSLPLGTYLKVTNLKNQKTVVVKVNDRLAKHNKRVVDLSKCSARKIGSIKAGLAKVKVEVIPAEEAKAILATY